jgi:hypothetical protein
MGQKINPIGFRLAVNKSWVSKWYATPKDFPSMLREDLEVRGYIKTKLKNAAVSKIVIERPAKNALEDVTNSEYGVTLLDWLRLEAVPGNSPPLRPFWSQAHFFRFIRSGQLWKFFRRSYQ